MLSAKCVDNDILADNAILATHKHETRGTNRQLIPTASLFLRPCVALMLTSHNI